MTFAVAPAAFDVCGPLPEGVTVLEASAGTGKTFTIAGLAARYVAAGVPLDQVLVVTFTRMATAELRDRVRERLVAAEQGLDRALAGTPPDGGDRVLALLADAPPEEVELRRQRLAAAVADFDAATIVTTHGFCQEILGGLGIAGDLEPGIEFVEDLRDLVEEVVDDLYVGAFHDREEVLFDRAQALSIALAADRNPGAPLEPADRGAGRIPYARYRLAERVRAELEVRKRRRGVMTYDDLLTRLDDALHGPGGEEIGERLRARYRIVLVDEFQDTDPIQWRIVRRAFGDGRTTLVLIGDPKQAIYAFRGADVYAYLDAARVAAATRTLDINWRSDQALVDAYDALFGDAQLGHPGIVYRRVRAAAGNVAPRLSGAPDAAALRVRVVHREDPGVGTTFNGFAPADAARAHIAEDLAGDVVVLLDSAAVIEERGYDGAVCDQRTVSPGDVAVLVRRNLDAELVRDALARAGVPAVLAGAGSVFDTQAADEWLRLLEALERPTSGARAGAAALTWFLGWSAADVATASDDRWEELHGRLHGWTHVLRTRGVAALAETIMHSERVPERVLGVTDGERRLTDLRHIGELLHGAAMEEQRGIAALTMWLRHRISDAADELGIEERSRRLESDDAAVQVLTIHRSKGLEFPVVYLPFLWHPSPVTRTGEPVSFHDPDDDDVRKVDVGLEGRSYRAHRSRSIAEQRGEDLRLMYVALTRARHQAVVWWAGTKDCRFSPLGRLVFFRGEDGSIADAGDHSPSDEAAMARFAALAAGAAGCISVERSSLGAPASWSPRVEGLPDLDAAAFARGLDRRWRRTSYSDLTAGTHEAVVGSEPEPDVVSDEPAEPVTLPGAGAPADGPLAAPSPLAAMPGGARVGTFVHDVLEAVDFAAPDLDGELAAHVGRARARRSVDVGSQAAVVAGLRGAIETPLGPLVGGRRLRDVRRADRLDELAFELPLAGGDRAAGEVTTAAIAAVLRRHVAAGDPLAGYADRLADPELRHAVRGYLTGSIDLVLRVPGPVPRFAVVDYKSNWLAAASEELTIGHHRPAALTAEMQRMHYVLQGLLYTVALHRYLRWRLPGYDAERNLAGILYLFLRGMAGADTPVVDGAPCGVFAWRPRGALVTELSDVLDRGAAA
ncbi:MAG TPA: UvrD-helicase domain-containing protein [Solirubrobacteraceae bacterium]|nr:UvrD-helicase domain-containing protein [Solirubrobacteraceae bacterium]